MNYQINLTHLQPPPGFAEADPVIVHYHDRVDADGYLLPTPYPRAQERIQAFNDRLAEYRRSHPMSDLPGRRLQHVKSDDQAAAAGVPTTASMAEQITDKDRMMAELRQTVDRRQSRIEELENSLVTTHRIAGVASAEVHALHRARFYRFTNWYWRWRDRVRQTLRGPLQSRPRVAAPDEGEAQSSAVAVISEDC